MIILGGVGAGGHRKGTRAIFLYLGLPDEYEHRVHDLRRPFQWEPDYNVTSVNYDFAGLRREKHWREKA